MRNILIFILFLAAFPAINGCFNPFFPETGLPPQVESSPERTVQQLKYAYEQRDVYAFEKLIYSTEEYSSYIQISDDYTSELTNISSFALDLLKIDTIFAPNNFWSPNRYYYELSWEQERKIHEKMFNRSNEIVFLSAFAAGETLYETSGTDTVSALVRTYPSQIRIKYAGEEFIADITGQIFAMKKENDIWKIWKWIELN